MWSGLTGKPFAKNCTTRKRITSALRLGKYNYSGLTPCTSHGGRPIRLLAHQNQGRNCFLICLRQRFDQKLRQITLRRHGVATLGRCRVCVERCSYDAGTVQNRGPSSKRSMPMLVPVISRSMKGGNSVPGIERCFALTITCVFPKTAFSGVSCPPEQQSSSVNRAREKCDLLLRSRQRSHLYVIEIQSLKY
jgi:hypothetical protein